ncbi:MAG TPA: hypothetical protein VKR06_09165, partial [Ktedonosporobacter sp.]|nr:hypothetical protein [Ktedonosporobacter sp.]
FLALVWGQIERSSVGHELLPFHKEAPFFPLSIPNLIVNFHSPHWRTSRRTTVGHIYQLPSPFLSVA